MKSDKPVDIESLTSTKPTNKQRERHAKMAPIIAEAIKEEGKQERLHAYEDDSCKIEAIKSS